NDDRVPVGVESRVLDVRVELIGPEPVDLVVGLAPAEHAPGGRGPLLHAVLPVLDAHLTAAHGVIVIGDVARGENAGHIGPALVVDDDSVVDSHGRAGDQLR